MTALREATVSWRMMASYILLLLAVAFPVPGVHGMCPPHNLAAILLVCPNATALTLQDLCTPAHLRSILPSSSLLRGVILLADSVVAHTAAPTLLHRHPLGTVPTIATSPFPTDMLDMTMWCGRQHPPSLHYEMLYAFAYKAIHEMTVLGKALIGTFFAPLDAGPNANAKRRLYAYYQGCSEGGREGWSQMQRYGDHFDGAAFVNKFLQEIVPEQMSSACCCLPLPIANVTVDMYVTVDMLRDWILESVLKYGELLQTTWPDLTAFRAHGSEILHWHGGSDGSIPVGSSVLYHDAVRRTMYPGASFYASYAALASWYLPFLVPGAGHCVPDPAQPVEPFPESMLGSIIDWVEHDIEPVILNATTLADETGGMLRITNRSSAAFRGGHCGKKMERSWTYMTRPSKTRGCLN